MSQCKKNIFLILFCIWFFRFVTRTCSERFGSSWSSVSRSGVGSSAVGGLDGDDRTERVYENTTQLPSKSCWSAESAQWAAWRHRKRITGVDIQRYSESDQAQPYDIHKRAHLHDTECFWSHQNNQNVFFLLPNDILTYPHAHHFVMCFL